MEQQGDFCASYAPEPFLFISRVTAVWENQINRGKWRLTITGYVEPLFQHLHNQLNIKHCGGKGLDDFRLVLQLVDERVHAVHDDAALSGRRTLHRHNLYKQQLISELKMQAYLWLQGDVPCSEGRSRSR